MSHESSELASALHHFSARVDTLSKMGDTNNHATVSVNAGGMGVWIATTAALIMLACNIFLAVIVLDHSRKIDELNAYLTAVYMMAPQLKPAEEAK